MSAHHMSNKQLIEALECGARFIEYVTSRTDAESTNQQSAINQDRACAALLRSHALSLSAPCPITVERLDQLIDDLDHRLIAENWHDVEVALTCLRRLIAGEK